ncbi:hypothetical protein AAMO2058_000481300 [Amorphochlora amoebiformis]
MIALRLTQHRLPRPTASRWFSFIRRVRNNPSFQAASANKETILQGLKKPEPQISPRWLYDDKGSALFEQITETNEYYLTRKELELLQEVADDIAPFPDEGDNADQKVRRVLVELGAGSGKKTTLILDAMKALSGGVTYVPIDVNEASLQENAKKYNFNAPSVEFKPIVSSYQDCLPDVAKMSGRKTFLFLGSSLGNYSDEECVDLLKVLSENMNPRDRFLLGVDTPHGSHKPAEVIEAAYNDKEGITAEFTLNSLNHVNKEADMDFETEKFRHIATYDKDRKAVFTFVESLEDQVVNSSGVPILNLRKSDRIFMEQSRKFSEADIKRLANLSNLVVSRSWTTGDKCHLLVELTRDDLKRAGEVSDWIFGELVPKGLGGLLEKPILLRHPFLFYEGHIAAFYQTKTLEEASEVKGFTKQRATDLSQIYERGIDPEITSGECRHRHSPPPTQWPSFEETKTYLDNVRYEISRKMFGNKERGGGWGYREVLGLEHEYMHQETLMYMAANSDNIRFQKPRGVADHPYGTNSPLTLKPTAEKGSRVFVPGADNVVLGASETVVEELGFVWDNEVPSMEVSVDSFVSSSLPITNREYLQFVTDGGYQRPEFWGSNWDMVNKNGEQLMEGAVSWIPKAGSPSDKKEFQVRTLLHGPQDMDVSGDWPVLVSLAEAQAYCKWVGNGARVMSELEYHLIFHHELNTSGEDAFSTARAKGNNTWKYSGVVPVGAMEDATPVLGISDLAGNGWEWTSSPFKPFPGFQPMELYEEYSTDFFGDTHFVMKGGSPFTDKQIIRLSFRNWFQDKYRYMWAKFRVSWDN